MATALTPLIKNSWSLPTALSLLAWYVFAPQCLSTLATVKRETNSWRYPLIMAGYLFALAYAASFVTYNVAKWAHGECMSAILANSIVVIAIVASACYAVWRLGPRKMRDALRTRLRTALPRVFGNLNDSSSGSGCDACGGGWRADDDEQTCGSQRARCRLAQESDALKVRTSVPAEAAAPPAAE